MRKLQFQETLQVHHTIYAKPRCMVGSAIFILFKRPFCRCCPSPETASTQWLYVNQSPMVELTVAKASGCSNFRPRVPRKQLDVFPRLRTKIEILRLDLGRGGVHISFNRERTIQQVPRNYCLRKTHEGYWENAGGPVLRNFSVLEIDEPLLAISSSYEISIPMD